VREELALAEAPVRKVVTVPTRSANFSAAALKEAARFRFSGPS